MLVTGNGRELRKDVLTCSVVIILMVRNHHCLRRERIMAINALYRAASTPKEGGFEYPNCVRGKQGDSSFWKPSHSFMMHLLRHSSSQQCPLDTLGMFTTTDRLIVMVPAKPAVADLAHPRYSSSVKNNHTVLSLVIGLRQEVKNSVEKLSVSTSLPHLSYVFVARVML